VEPLFEAIEHDWLDRRLAGTADRCKPSGNFNLMIAVYLEATENAHDVDVMSAEPCAKGKPIGIIVAAAATSHNLR
jgi:hypothetical protein